MSLSREEIIQFLETIVHRTITSKSEPETFTKITQALWNHYREIGSTKFSKETLDRIEKIRVTRSAKKKALIVEIKYTNSKKFQAISWTSLYKTSNKVATPNHRVTQALRQEIRDQLAMYRY